MIKLAYLMNLAALFLVGGNSLQHIWNKVHLVKKYLRDNCFFYILRKKDNISKN